MSGYRPDRRPSSQDIQHAVEMIHAAKRPVILAGHGVLMSGAMAELKEFAERTQTPIAMTLLGLGGFPGSHPLNMGMMGMHGEAWVNNAIQDADLLLAFGMRFDDRVTGNLKTYAPERPEDPRRNRPVRNQQKRHTSTRPWSAICAAR